ncbi:hypothetical protein HPP92_006914 [Vanilla planifolia]|uniref:Uncharacterized protein n=1 Tax=Vanilla planifolia TaxID=51239 RepID=A0A835RKU6_VANPL|nr:hypothetical protein HPP92_006914 [Vanilla planifolia]
MFSSLDHLCLAVFNLHNCTNFPSSRSELSTQCPLSIRQVHLPAVAVAASSEEGGLRGVRCSVGWFPCVADDEGPAVTPFQDYEWVGTEFGDTEGRERNFKTVGQAVAVAVAVAVAATASRALSFT